MNWFNQSIVVFALVLLPLASHSASAKKGVEENKDCPQLTKTEATAILQKLKDAQAAPPNTAVLDVKVSPVKGLWLVELQLDGTQGAFFIDCSKKYIAMQLVPIEAIRPRLQKADFSKLPLQEAVILGSADATKKVAVFTDPDCPACRQLHDIMKQVIDKRKNIAFYLFLYPLPMHKDAYKKAQAIMCDKSLSLLDDAFAGKELPEPKCSNERVEKNLALGTTVRIEGTPTIIREDGALYNGARQPDAMIQWIEGK